VRDRASKRDRAKQEIASERRASVESKCVRERVRLSKRVREREVEEWKSGSVEERAKVRE
jgi:hypothetical protein